jgi:2-C-methyl-D-erythritol 2,4-cyclodiphosphate synthase
LALGDIGVLFPDSDAQYKGIDSSILLSRTAALIREKGWQIGNIDATVLAQAPRLAPHISQMRENIAKTLAISTDAVSIKATTEEGLGFTGEGLGIAAHAVCLLFRA